MTQACVHGLQGIFKFLPWISGFTLLETVFDWYQEKEHLAHPCLAGLISSGVYAMYYRLPRASSLKAIQYATLAGLLQGCLERSILNYFQLPTKYISLAPETSQQYREQMTCHSTLSSFLP
ncbi:hypothetical protein HMI54_011485 [Coelomomyces lativittatus]|nr:hypothetical protein HMI54_011485 [Coelomomyces lativittatus]